jgi:hypothetical protein
MAAVEQALIGRPASRDASVEIVVPVFNEQDDLEWSVRRLRAYLDSSFPFDAVVTVADNASTDATWGIATALAEQLPGVQAVHLDAKGRGRALRVTWLASRADVVAYVDVDLATDLRALLPLVAPLLSGHSDVAIGSRLARGAQVVRGPKREFISRCYNLLLRTTLHSRFSDAQCGFKAVRTDVARALLPMVEDNAWFFDTELLTLAEANGLRVHEVPVDWTDDPDSRVDIARTATDDLKGVCRLLRARSAGSDRIDFAAAGGSRRVGSARPGHFSVPGAAVCAGVFVVLRPALGPYAAGAAAMAAYAAGGMLLDGRLAALRRKPRLALGDLGTVTAQAGVTSLMLAAVAAAGAGSLPAEVAVLLAGIPVTALAIFGLQRARSYRARLFGPKHGAAHPEPTRAVR